MRRKFEIIHPDVLLRAAGNSTPTFIHLLRTFLRIGPEMLQEMQDAFAAGDAKRLSYHAHSLKNCIALLGAQKESQMLTNLESSARKNDHSLDSLLFSQIVQQIHKVIHEVKGCLAEAES